MNTVTSFYRFADMTFRISGDQKRMYREEGVLEPFRVEGPSWDHSICYEVVDALPLPEGECVYQGPRIQVFRQGDTLLTCRGDTALLPEGAHTHMIRRGNQTLVQVLRREVTDRIMPRLVLNTLEAEHHIVQCGGFLLHSSFIQVKGKAILFTAPSGTGKSTQAALWEKHRGARIVNGDRTAVTIENGTVMAHGIPYCGTSGIYGQAKVPVAAIVYLSQGAENRIEPLTGLRAFRRLWEGCSVQLWEEADVTLCSQRVTEAVQRVNVVHLTCTPDEGAVRALEAYLEETVYGGEKKQ